MDEIDAIVALVAIEYLKDQFDRVSPVSPARIGTTDIGGEGTKAILRERIRQIHILGWSTEHDDTHTDRELLLAAFSYIVAANRSEEDCRKSVPPGMWPFEREAWDPHKGRIRCLEKAGAFLAAEIDRLKRGQENGQ